MGARKLLKILRKELEEMNISIGRDQFFDLLREHDLLVRRRRRHGAQTTYSHHHFHKYSNLLKDMKITGPNQAWVSDLTYVRTDEGFLYVSLITDSFSRKIVGYEGADTLEATGCLKALGMATKQLPADAHPVHHSDRGIQYCCGDYVKSLEKQGIGISMTEENHCYENAKAERVNGILKQEYGLGSTFLTKAHALEALREGVFLYNELRPHMALNYRFPSSVHRDAA